MRRQLPISWWYDQFAIRSARVLTFGWVCFTLSVVSCPAADQAPSAATEKPVAVDYLRDVKPIFARRCFSCHGPIQQKSELRLDTAAAMLKGGENGPAITAGKPDDSDLLSYVRSDSDFRMPPAGEGTPLTSEEIDILTRWIARGAKAPADEKPLIDPRNYWSYQLPQRAALPEPKRTRWTQHPVDRFIAAQHDTRGLTPRPQAEPAILLRRLFLDLIGLPPTRVELHRFLADPSEDNWNKTVDDLLGRPEYGERWGRHWMDVWRYSDWYGSRAINEIRYSQRHIWRWRDWIVESLNEDKGYDQMIVEMIAGDELAPTDPMVLRATGFLGRNWYKFDRNVWMFETVEKTSQAFLGLTLKCCRCHDHKFDPIEQQDYYRFRAFFEPHDVRTDRLSVTTGTEKDATLGQVLKNGVARVYDKQLDVPTYRFIRGDARYPDKDNPLFPGVPAALGNADVKIETVTLPPAAFYPALRPELVEAQLAQSSIKVEDADKAVAAAKQKVQAAQAKLAEVKRTRAAGKATAEPDVFLADDFAKARPNVWKPVSGQWVYENGHLIEKQVTSFATMVTLANHPRDFRASVRYRALKPGSYRSIGLSFDYVNGGQSQDVYTATGDATQSIQAFHRDAGKQVYPKAGIVPVELMVGEEATIEVAVRGSHLKLRLNGELKLDYVMPLARRDGNFALWVHQGSAEFLEVEIRGFAETPAELQRIIATAVNQVAIEHAKRKTAVAEHAALIARIAAERSKYAVVTDPNAHELALAASRAERQVAVTMAERELLQAEQLLAATSKQQKSPTALKQRDAAAKKLAAARAAVRKPDGKYAPLGKQFPRQSTGRRLALARWIANEKNPRTARIAVNHIWMRHFGSPIVSTVANFGLNGRKPTHPALLDWLAVELVENGWSMKHLHRLLVTSKTYRMVSSDGGLDSPNRKLDKDNIYLWRMNSRRMEAEVVRDSILATSGSLDRTRGGPEIDEKKGQDVFRRSMYFRNTPNEKMPFLEIFDVANPNACYRRIESVVPHQALALGNSSLALGQSRLLAANLSSETGAKPDEPTNRNFITAAFEQILSRPPVQSEIAACEAFLTKHAALVQQEERTAFPPSGKGVRAPSNDPHQRARENLVHVLFSHNDFVTIR
jgi:mono/diheme cytochrome c family protein